MSNIKISVVEDEVIIADDIQALLQDIGYDCLPPCGNYTEGVAMLKQHIPDLAIIDINLGSKPDGVALAKYIREYMDMPFIFLTANSDPATVERARETRPDAYLVKPFQKADLYVAIEVALHNFSYEKKNRRAGKLKKETDNLFIKEGEYFHKIPIDKILYLNSEHVYVVVHTVIKKFLVRTSMQEYLDTLDPERFIRVHRSYAVNIDNIEKIGISSLIVGGEEIPISQKYRDELLRVLNI